jgi:hypothetical protein
MIFPRYMRVSILDPHDLYEEAFGYELVRLCLDNFFSMGRAGRRDLIRFRLWVVVVMPSPSET